MGIFIDRYFGYHIPDIYAHTVVNEGNIRKVFSRGGCIVYHSSSKYEYTDPTEYQDSDGKIFYGLKIKTLSYDQRGEITVELFSNHPEDVEKVKNPTKNNIMLRNSFLYYRVPLKDPKEYIPELESARESMIRNGTPKESIQKCEWHTVISDTYGM